MDQKVQYLICIVFQQLLRSHFQIFFLREDDALDCFLVILIAAEVYRERRLGCRHTLRLILRPSVTSSGRIFKKSNTQSPALGPNAEPTVARTSFHSRT